ncbi:MAG: hemerythrin domain-containing protein, partial [Planctomycetaceae bacterium]|nr:hemerythrin domain-containing protein [Planctomycetaceae bacterium]
MFQVIDKSVTSKCRFTFKKRVNPQYIGENGVESHPELSELQQVFAGLKSELEPHMFKEERILFPTIRQLEQASDPISFPFGSVANPIRMVEHEHNGAGGALAKIRQSAQAYHVPDDACPTYQVMLYRLRELGKDLHQHIHK